MSTPQTGSVLKSVAVVNSGRSPDHRCWYEVGTRRGKRVYWHPIESVAVEEDCSQLVQLVDTSEVHWSPSRRLMRDLVSNPRLWNALPDGLAAACEASDDLYFAEDCARERGAVVEAANASLMEAW